MVFDDSSSDEELMREYQNGADGAFDLLFKRHSSRVYGFLMNRLKNRAQADDVFQLTFLKLHQARRHYDPSFPFAPWLFTVCKSVLTDSARKLGRNREEANDELVSSAVDEASIESASELRPTVAMDGLSSNQRVALELRYFEDLQFEEIAERLKTSPSNVRKLVSRGIQSLKRRMERKEKNDDKGR
jgi:RNA polymerase sigma factor (sigma-70 family)